WSVHLLGEAYALPLWRLGVLPREWTGIHGIVTAPLVHGDLGHLFNNSLPILFLGWALVYFYPRVAWRVVLGVWLLTGLWVWISARGDRHIGASGVVYGLASFLFFSGVIRGQRALMALSLLVVFLYGGMVWGVLPLAPRMSWESHLWGAISGVAMAVVYRQVSPAYLPEPAVVEEDPEEHDPVPSASGVGPIIVYHYRDGQSGEAGQDVTRAGQELHRGSSSSSADTGAGKWERDLLGGPERGQG
ncbi:MAG: rhomboid family intramembrane serine protease, partial [Flavobacteriales bacterium]|nr:rhomboid family intramembrane serine protease [Flavobacteriales bacterium]